MRNMCGPCHPHANPLHPQEKGTNASCTSALAGELPEAFQMLGRMHVPTADGVGDVTDVQIAARVNGAGGVALGCASPLSAPRPASRPPPAQAWPSWRSRAAPPPPITITSSRRAGRAKTRGSVRLDLRYVENWSLTLDLVILLRTLSAVCRGAGAYGRRRVV